MRFIRGREALLRFRDLSVARRRRSHGGRGRPRSGVFNVIALKHLLIVLGHGTRAQSAKLLHGSIDGADGSVQFIASGEGRE